MSSPRPIKRVRFNEKVKIVEIQQVEQLHEDDTTDHTEDEDDRTFDFRNGVNRSDTASSTDSSRCFLSKKFGTIKKPTRIPLMLFSSLPVPNGDLTSSSSSSISSSSIDGRWSGVETNHSKVTSFAPSAPIRIPSLDQILDNVLAVLEEPPSATASKGVAAAMRCRHDSDKLSSRMNHPWDMNDLLTTSKRRVEDSPPVIPLRRISEASLLDAGRRIRNK